MTVSNAIRLARLLLIVIVFSVPALPQTQGVDILLGKARSLEARGRMDLAALNWRQALLANPNQVEALAGLARYAKENGNAAEERGYLDRLRKINPSDPAIAVIEKMKVVTPEERRRLEEAGRLAMQGKPDEAMKIYRDVLGEEPPPGKWAQPYYEAETASKSGREKAIAQLRQVCARNPKNEVYRFWLARALAYDPKTRTEAFRLLESVRDAGAVEQARATWRQALLWEKDNPDVRTPLEAYLQRYPDPELQNILTFLREKQQREIVNADEKHGYEALNRGDFAAAQTQFQQALEGSPKDPSAIAGLGFVRLKQKRFDEALELFDRARTLAPQRKDIQQGYDDAKFLGIMERASVELGRNLPDAAVTTYQQALTLRPSEPQALLGLGQALMREGKFREAEGTYQQVLNQSSNNVDAIAGIGLARLKQGDFAQAVERFEQVRRLDPNRADIREAYETAKYWGTMKQAAAALEQNHPDAAVAAYRQALALRPGTKDTLLGLAQALEDKKDYAGAAQSYTQLTAADPGDVQGWLGLIRAQIKANDAKAALSATQRIPQPTRGKIESRSDYLSEVALAYYQTNQPSEGDLALRRASDAAASSDSEDAMNIRLQVASTLVDQGNIEGALAVYKQATELHPDNVVAWDGLVGAYARTRDFSGAQGALNTMPRASYAAAAKNASFLNAVASIYSAQGRCEEAEDLLNRALSLDKAAGRQPSPNAEMQLADLWMRERHYHKAGEKYQEILERNNKRSDAWRAYIVALHAEGADQRASSEMQRLPSGIAGELEKDPHFLSLLANIEVAQGHNSRAVRWLEQARASYQSLGQGPPAADLDVQLAWLLLVTRENQQQLPGLLLQTNARKDLTAKQRNAVHSIWATLSVRQAKEAMQRNKSKESESILLDASRALPGDPQVRAALSAFYMRRHEYYKALNVYLASGMAEAQAADYRAAAAAALAAHKTEMADQFLQNGLQQWPRDPELLHMSAKQAASKGNYKEAERDLNLALSAMRSGEGKSRSASPQSIVARAPNPAQATGDSFGASSQSTGSTSSDTIVAGCGTSSDTKSNHASVKPIAMVWTERADLGEDDDRGNANPVTPQEQQRTQDEIDIIRNRNTPFVSVDDTTGGRTGDPGFNRLIIQDGALGSWGPINNRVRLGFEAHSVYLFSGTPNGNSTLSFGTLPQATPFGEQSALGYGGEVQLSTTDFGLMFGTSPQGFETRNLIGGVRFRPLHGPLTLLFVRDSVKDSLLSYAGVRDPGTGLVWGGVVSNSGSLQLRRDARRNGQYLTVRYSDIRGTRVPDNSSVDGNAGVYFNAVQKPHVGFSLGVDVGGMHYEKNLQFFTLGQGGYFSPQQYYRASVPITLSGQHNRLEYELAAAGGVQHFTEDASPFFPVAAGVPLPTQSFYNSEVHSGPSYSGTFRINYRVTDHVNFGLFADANNSRNFATQTVGFSLKFLVHRVPTNPELQVHSIPDWRGNAPFDLH